VFKVLVGKPEGKRPLGRPRRRWEKGPEWILGRLAGGGGVDWIRLAQDRDRCYECGDEPSGSCATELVCVVKTVATVMLLRDFGPYGVIFINVCIL
jgi:hypothetical protein